MRYPRPAAAAVLDVCCVLIFVIIGRASHAKGETLAGIASTAWPFLAGLGIGWALALARAALAPAASPGDDRQAPSARAWRRAGSLTVGGVVVWLGTVAFGMVLRVVSGQGTAVSFVIVALVFLGLFLLGWRVIWRVAAHLRAGRAAGRRTAA